MDDDEDTINAECDSCGGRDFFENDGFYYCRDCGTQADGRTVTGLADEDFIDKTGRGGGGLLYNARNTRRSQQTTLSQGTEADLSSQLWYRLTQEDEQENDKGLTPKEEKSSSYYDPDLDMTGPSEPGDFGEGATGELENEHFCNEVRIRYVTGLQRIVQLQCEALVEEFGVSPLIVGVVSSVWLRFVAVSGVFRDEWANDTVLESESQKFVDEEDDSKFRSRNELQKHAAMVWFRKLRETIPLDYSLAMCFLACHVAREPVLPTDLVKWSIEGKIPYFAAHIEIEKHFEGPSLACPISPSLMFRPSQPVPVQKLEAMAATIADSVGLHLPPVNFYEVAGRYLKQLSLPSEKILPHACRIYEWSMPPDLWLSANVLRLPTRVCVMSILIISIRFLYNLNGLGAWERSVSNFSSSQTSELDPEELDPEELLHNLEAGFSEIGEPCDFAKDLTAYLQYCNDMVFAGKGSSLQKDRIENEEELIEKLWDYYQTSKDHEPIEEDVALNRKRDHEPIEEDVALNRKRDHEPIEEDVALNRKRLRIEKNHGSPTQSGSSNYIPSPQQQSKNNYNTIHEQVEPSNESSPSIAKLKTDMEENRFCYIPPRVNVKKSDGYLHYVRKQDHGSYRYIAHADYYILLRSCAKVAQVDIRIMHIGVLCLERRLAWLEKRIDYCLDINPPILSCEFCADCTPYELDDHGV
ncbi:TATA box-binding protein-associated factor RNA polymerase I subunit B [Linum perenne]